MEPGESPLGLVAEGDRLEGVVEDETPLADLERQRYPEELLNAL
jgi:hypothetical protein